MKKIGGHHDPANFHLRVVTEVLGDLTHCYFEPRYGNCTAFVSHNVERFHMETNPSFKEILTEIVTEDVQYNVARIQGETNPSFVRIHLITANVTETET